MPKFQTLPEAFKSRLDRVASFDVRLAWRSLYCGIETLTYGGVVFRFVDNEYYFKREALYGYGDDGERTAFFSKAALEALRHIGWVPDIIHCHDWHAALIPVLLKGQFMGEEPYRGIKTVFTIHNPQYQGIYPPGVLGDLLGLDWSSEAAGALRQFDTVNYLRGALACSGRISPVSPTYTEEILT